MPLTPDTRIGPYRITAPLGAGGMGEVFRATDTNLKRDVAIKVLPLSVAANPDRLSRFQREAEVLAALNHPNIAAIYGLERSGTTTALVMELVEGPTLAEVIGHQARGTPAPADSNASSGRGTAARLARRGLEIGDALRIARQIAEALEAAHEQGIVHRDLKPANIKIRTGRLGPSTSVPDLGDGLVKLLDFGLAKALEPALGGAAVANLADSPTLTTPAMTESGVILGTAAYMAPEQARGRPVDRRTDVWAFGCVLYEMLTGRLAFDGEDVSETLAAVLRGEPDWNALPAGTPAPVRRLLRRCLVKDRRQRLGDMTAVRLDLDDALSSQTEVEERGPVMRIPSPRARWTAFGSSLLLGALLAAGIAWLLRPEPSRLPVVHLTVDLPLDHRLFGNSGPAITVSRDGRMVAFFAGDRSPSTGASSPAVGLFVRTLDSPALRHVTSTELAYAPFFAPDGRELGYFSQGRLWRIPVTGGAPVQIAAVDPQQDRGATWAPDGFIYVGGAAGVWRVPAGGGGAETLTTVDRTSGEIAHRFPRILPHGRALVFTSFRGALDDARIGVLELDTKRTWRLDQPGHAAQYIPTGQLLFLRAGALMAAPFDLSRLALVGSPQPVVNDVAFNNGGAGHFDVSDDGVLAYVPGVELARSTAVWADRQGRTVQVGVPADAYREVVLSPDNRRIALVRLAAGLGSDIVIWDLIRPGLTSMTRNAAAGNRAPVWISDREIVFASRPGGLGSPAYLFRSRFDATEVPERLLQQAIEGRSGSTGQEPGSVSGDASRLFFSQFATSDDGLYVVSLATSATELVRRGGHSPRISPDSRWLAYSDRGEIWVQPYAGDATAWQISTGGGAWPRWSGDARELFYRSGSSVMVATLDARTGFADVRPRVLFDAPGTAIPFDVTADGQRFVLLQLDAQPELVPHIVTNWFERLRSHPR